MTERSIVRENLMNQKGYTPYCGNPKARQDVGGCANPRMIFNGEKFVCPKCGWVSKLDEEFINRYKVRWNL